MLLPGGKKGFVGIALTLSLLMKKYYSEIKYKFLHNTA